jgi:pimeloyl-ACP methyl ester carboxylesterase
VVPADQAAAVAEVIPHARTHLMPGAGHAPFIEDADAFNAVVREFLSRVYQPVHAGAGR